MTSVTPNAAPQQWGITTDKVIKRVDTDLKDSYVFTVVDVDDDDLAMGISTPTTSNDTNANAAIYDLFGRKVEKPAQHGVYIKGGKKFVK